MSRLDSFINRLQAQRACLGRAAREVADVPGVVLELGLGNGRTFDHLRELMPEREIHVFDRQLAAHPDCVPDAERLHLGEFRETLAAAARALPHAAALAHVDCGSGHAAQDRELARALGPLLDALMAGRSLVVSDQPLEHPRWRELPPPEGVEPGRYHVYRVNDP